MGNFDFVCLESGIKYTTDINTFYYEGNLLVCLSFNV